MSDELQSMRRPRSIGVAISVLVALTATGCGADHQSHDTTSSIESSVVYRGTSLIEFAADATARQIEAVGNATCGTRGYTVTSLTTNGYVSRIFVVCGPEATTP